MSDDNHQEQIEAERRARVEALADKPGEEIRWLRCTKLGTSTWDCEWELSDGSRGGLLSVNLKIVREPET